MFTNPHHRVLVADDAPALAEALTQLLSDEGLEVVGPARDGREALTYFERFEPDAAVLDLNMPGLSGLEVLRVIRQRRPNCLVIIVTEVDEPSIRTACLEAGAAHFLSKSRDLYRLGEFVRSQLKSPSRHSADRRQAND